MFNTFEIDDKFLEEIIINSFNNLFENLQDQSLKSYKDLVDQKLLLNLCLEMDEANFKQFKKSLLFEKNFGIFFAEIKELVMNIIEILRNSGVSFKQAFNKDFDNFNINLLLKHDLNELKRLLNLIILFIFNCAEKEKFIDKIVNFEEYQQQEFLKIVERYMVIEDGGRESILPRSRKISNRNTINNIDSSLLESEFTQKFLSRIDFLEKDREDLEKHKIKSTLKINEIESENENLKKEKIESMNELAKAKENFIKIENENKEIKKLVYDNKLKLDELEVAAKDGKLTAEFRIKLDQKEADITYLNKELNELKETHKYEIKELQEKIEILEDKISNLNENKTKYMKMKEFVKEYEALKDKSYLSDSIEKEYLKMKKEYDSLSEEKESLENLVKELEKKLEESIVMYRKLKKGEDKHDNSNHEQVLRAKEDYIKQLEIKVNKLESLRVDNLNAKEDKQKDLNKENNDMKMNIVYYIEKINKLEKELEIKNNNTEPLKKKDEEIELLKKESLEMKDRYEKEFELIASSVYNLGLNYWSMKLEYTQRLSEKPSWLVKERQKYFNGDF